MKTLHLLAAAAITLGSVQAFARAPVPILNHESLTVQRAGGQAASADQVRQAILVASQATGRKWTVSDAAPGQLVASYSVRSHTVVADIRYRDGAFSVSYKDSVNMKYTAGGTGGPGSIHPFYNQWVQEFIQAIRAELART